MPIFEFFCRACKNEFERLVMGTDRDVVCPRCGGSELDRKFSVFGFQSGGKFSSAAPGKGCSHCSNPGGCAHCH